MAEYFDKKDLEYHRTLFLEDRDGVQKDKGANGPKELLAVLDIFKNMTPEEYKKTYPGSQHTRMISLEEEE